MRQIQKISMQKETWKLGVPENNLAKFSDK